MKDYILHMIYLIREINKHQLTEGRDPKLLQASYYDVNLNSTSKPTKQKSKDLTKYNQH